MFRSTAFLLAFVIAACGPAPKTDAQIRSKVLKLKSDHSMCSAEQVRAPSGKDYILTAGHCHSMIVDGIGTITDEDGKQYKVKYIEEDGTSDLMLLEGIPGIRGMDIAKAIAKHQHVRAFVHANDLDTHKIEGEVIQEITQVIPLMAADDPRVPTECSLPKHSIQIEMSFFGPQVLCVVTMTNVASTMPIKPGASGGPVVDDKGDLVGVCSASGEGYGYFVRLKDIQRFLANR